MVKTKSQKKTQKKIQKKTKSQKISKKLAHIYRGKIDNFMGERVTRTYWTGSMADVVFSVIYLLSKYRSICYPYNDKKAWDYGDIMIQFVYTNEKKVQKIKNSLMVNELKNESNYYDYYNQTNIDIKQVRKKLKKLYELTYPGGKYKFVKMIYSCKKRYIIC